ncbi:MAG: 1-deoxy-D-xylulose-5-phosphate synthase [Muribaculaceae bacterium]|nr:1-deoxy-D-xylulose-5-phosphate synthase [Muribaculaceae bacterium]
MIQEQKDKTAIGQQQYPLLSGIKSPADLKKLSVAQLPFLCDEIREYLISCLSVNPGHFGSSMGAVDIIVALHYVFDTPRDRIVFDVGHQAYSHKLLTGRYQAFLTQRKKNGISGFPFPFESEYDSFVCGHAGNSISAALGMAIADMNTPGEEDRKTVALIGDASIGNGLAFEGLNNASQNPNNLLIILNDNEMSIDDNVGALHRYLSEMSTSAGYNRLRFKLYGLFRKWGLIEDKGKGLVLRFNNALKSLVARQQNIFEGLNIRYFGPFNGNDVTKIVKILQDIKEMKGPRILHLHTRKGKGYAAAENNPAPWHAPGKFDPDTARRQSEAVSTDGVPLWQDVFGDTLVELAGKNESIVGITAAMPTGTSMNKMACYPHRMFDVGISEGHAITFAGGLAAAGKRPFVAVYSSFLQRGFDNIIHDVAIQGLPVTFCIDRAGIVGEDGVTHHGIFDMSYLRIIPGLKVAAPMDCETLRNIMSSSLEWSGPLAIRYPRGKADSARWKTPFAKVEPGKSRLLHESSDSRIAVLSVGPIGFEVSKVLEHLQTEGLSADHYDMIWVKPLDEDALRLISEKYAGIVTVEDGCVDGGFGSAVDQWFERNRKSVRIINLGIPDRWIYQGTVAELRAECGFDSKGIHDAVAALYNELSNADNQKNQHSPAL